jgi:hypothetical protein
MPRYLIRDAEDLDRLSAREQRAWERAGAALATARREEIFLGEAARRERTTVDTVRRYFPNAVVRRGDRGWWRASKSDSAYRGHIHITGEQGDALEDVRDWKQRQLASDHALALKAYLDGQDPEGRGLRRFRGKRIHGHRLLDDRDLDLIDRLDQAGELDWPDMYERGPQ